MARKIVYPPTKELIRLGRGKPSAGTSTYTESRGYAVAQKPDPYVPTPRALIEEIRRRAAERSYDEPVSRRTAARIDQALKKLEQRRRLQIVRLIHDLRNLPPQIKTAIARAGRWYRKHGEVGVLMPRARVVDGAPVRLHVPIPRHVESTIWKILGEAAANDHS
jgi:hypothetical protein